MWAVIDVMWERSGITVITRRVETNDFEVGLRREGHQVISDLLLISICNQREPQ